VTPLLPLWPAAFLFADYRETGRLSMPKDGETRDTPPATRTERQ
jgi:hypothetical protein